MASCSKSKDNLQSTNKTKRKKRKHEETVQVLKHYDIFYGQAPPGLVQEEKDHPEDCIPNLPENQDAREFLAKAPTKGLWMPLGKEVKVMKCWRCKTYGHRTGDRECPLFVSGNAAIEKFRYVHEDPMHNFISETKRMEKEERIRQLQALLESSSDSSDSSSDKHKHKKHKRHKKEKRKKGKKKKKKKEK